MATTHTASGAVRGAGRGAVTGAASSSPASTPGSRGAGHNAAGQLAAWAFIAPVVDLPRRLLRLPARTATST